MFYDLPVFVIYRINVNRSFFPVIYLKTIHLTWVKMTTGQLKVCPDKWSSWPNIVHWLAVIWALVITEWLEKVNSSQGNPINMVTIGPKKLAVLMSALDNTVVMTVLSRVLTSKCMVVCRAAKKSGRSNEVADYWGGRKVGFH